ncbi:MAG: hypothetical protein MZV65_31535 [Chromatiales bacterium]|nr:hypothetical protein [Chromatiales bacterium]
MPPIDLHILRSRRLAYRSVRARSMASTEGQPVNVHVVPYAGHAGQARAEGYRHGNAPYVAFLDADDELLAGGMDALLNVLEADSTLCGAFGGEERVAENGRVAVYMDRVWSPHRHRVTGAPAPHNAILMRREAVTPHLNEIAAYPCRADRLLRALVTQYGPWRAVPVPAYRWYLRAGTLRSRQLPDDQRLALRRRIDSVLRVAERREFERRLAA